VRVRKTYYSVHALRDGTIWLAFETRKPMRRKRCREPKIDEDGVHSWFLTEKEEEVDRLSDWGKGVFHTSVAVGLNMRRITREHVTTRLDRIEKRMAGLQEQLGQVLERLKGGTVARESKI
jgi:hypothetical protein